MRRMILAAALLTASCATTASTVHEDAGKALIAAESAVDTAALAADTAVKAHLTTRAQDAKIVKLAATVKADLVIARKAYAASDAATMTAMATQLTSLAAQLDGAH